MNIHTHTYTGSCLNHTSVHILTMECTRHVISRRQILLVLVLLTSCSCQSTYYVTPTLATPCPGEPCHTLSEYVAGHYFDSLPVNTTMEFLPGNHTLEQTVSVTNSTCLALRGDSSSLPNVTSSILCTLPSGFFFIGVTELHIRALAFVSCLQENRAAVSLISVSQSNISNCIFQNNANTFRYNIHSGIDYRFNGGALHMQYSYVILTENKFLNNSAASGGALYMETSISIITGNTFEFNSDATNGGALM